MSETSGSIANRRYPRLVTAIQSATRIREHDAIAMSETFGSIAQRRYPRLIASIQAATGLCEPDAISAVVEYMAFGIRDAHESMDSALRDLGGPLQVIRSAIRCRRGGM